MSRQNLIFILSILAFSQILFASSNNENAKPFSKLSSEYTKKLECTFAKTLKVKDMKRNFKDLDIQSADDILYYLDPLKIKSIDNFAKALILDYIYNKEEAIRFYRKSYSLANSNPDVAYDIAYFLARDAKPESAIKVIDDQYTFLNEFMIAKLKAFVYLSNDMKVPHKTLSRLRKKNTTIEDIKEAFNNCKTSFIF